MTASAPTSVTLARFSLSAFDSTNTLDSPMAPAPIIGESIQPKAG